MPVLNTQQDAVVDWALTGTGHLNLIARAGCGKTFTLMEVIKALLAAGKQELAMMAYNKSAADEFKARLKALADSTGDDRYTNNRHVAAGTVHSFGFGSWRYAAPGVRVDDKKVYRIIDEMAETTRQDVYKDFSSVINNLVSLAKQAAAGVLWAIEDDERWQGIIDHHGIESNGSTDIVIAASQNVLRESFKRDRHTIDFDDMILAPLYHKGEPGVKIWPKHWVLVDEAQDTNPARRALAFAMMGPQSRLIAVGDDRQAIYGFTGADSDSLDIIREQLSSAVLPLNITYRCPKAVVAEANKIVPDITAADEAPEGIVRRITPVVDGKAWFIAEGIVGGDAVLCRNTKPLVEEAYKMLKNGIGCRVEGRDIGEGLITLARKWKSIRSLGILCDKVKDWSTTEKEKALAKGKDAQAQSIEDKADTLLVIADKLIEEGKTDVEDLVSFIRSLFLDTSSGERPNVPVLSTVHKAKGREWDRVYILNRKGLMPSRYAKQEWQLLQEANLEYVAVTRAKKELIDVA